MKKKNKKILKKANRSGKLPCNICKNPEFLVKHHINGREIVGAEEEWNILWVCPNDHEKIHNGLIIVEGWFMTGEGRTIIWHYSGEQSITGMEANTYVR